MLMSSLADRYAYQFLEARAHSRAMSSLSTTSSLTITDAYDIAKSLDVIRIAEGDVPIGRKLTLVKQQSSGNENIDPIPIWTSLFSSTVRALDDTHTIQSLAGAMQPKLEPVVVFKLAKTPSADATIDELAESLDWMSHGLEIVVNPYLDDSFDAADAIAAFGMHGTLLLGEPHIVSSASRHHLGQILADASVSLSCDERLLGAGYGSNVLGNPLNALWHLQRLLKSQTQFPSLQAGEIISTGSWSNAHAIQAGQTWSTAFSGISLAGLSVSFI